jgi:uncharacterized protein
VTPHILALHLPVPLTDVGRSLREAFYMLWDTLWALVLGFTLSGAVQAFVSRQAMRRHLGDHRAHSVLRAAVYGTVSSSCSYAASAMARSLVARGADYLAAMVFMTASTNLVIELGIVLGVLIGWQFVVAQYVGGVVMIVLLVALGSLWLRGAALAAPSDGGDAGVVGAAGGGSGTGAAAHDGGAGGWRKARTRAGWREAAGYTFGDLTMLRREIVIGFVVAGFLTVLVPVHAWTDVFLEGHGVWTDLENAVVGPFVAVVSFVCSIGNVALAAALWRGGVSFGGVMAFVFADLVSLPLLLVYRRQYGTRQALRMLGTFWVVMSAAGFVTGLLFQAAGWVPSVRPGSVVVGDTFRWNWTTGLDAVSLVTLAALFWLRRQPVAGAGPATTGVDPVCGMQVDTSSAPARSDVDGAVVYFCSDRCRDRYLASRR